MIWTKVGYVERFKKGDFPKRPESHDYIAHVYEVVTKCVWDTFEENNFDLVGV